MKVLQAKLAFESSVTKGSAAFHPSTNLLEIFKSENVAGFSDHHESFTFDMSKHRFGAHEVELFVTEGPEAPPGMMFAVMLIPHFKKFTSITIYRSLLTEVREHLFRLEGTFKDNKEFIDAIMKASANPKENAE